MCWTMVPVLEEIGQGGVLGEGLYRQMGLIWRDLRDSRDSRRDMD